MTVSECEYCGSDASYLIECDSCKSLFCCECVDVYIFYCPFCMHYWDFSEHIKEKQKLE